MQNISAHDQRYHKWARLRGKNKCIHFNFFVPIKFIFLIAVFQTFLALTVPIFHAAVFDKGPTPCPGEQVQTEFDHRGVQAVEFVVELEPVGRGARLTALVKQAEQRLIEGGRPLC